MKVMIVDDEKDILEGLVSLLKPLHYIIDTDTDPIMALERIKKENDYNLVITDIRMADMTGIELLNEIKAFNKQIHVIIMSAYDDMDTAITCINNRGYAFFSKPINVQGFIATLRELNNELSKIENITSDTDIEQATTDFRELRQVYQKLLDDLKSIS